MSTPSNSSHQGKLGRLIRGLGWVLRELGERSYALILIFIIFWLSWRAITYLVAALILPARAPSQIVDIPTRLNESVMMRASSGGKSALVNVQTRSPLSHYHRLDQGFQPDSLNGCTASQCHSPLPHGRNKADRAFLNMHSTSIHCAVCHTQQDGQPLPLAWYDLKTGRVKDQAPALLQAFAWLTSPAIRHTNTFTVDDQTEIAGLLRRAAVEADAEAGVVSLADHLAAVRASSEEFSRLIKVTRQALQGHFRGEYGAKLALVDQRSGKPLLEYAGTAEAAREYLAQRLSLSDEERQQLITRIHPHLRSPTLHCKACHCPEGSLVDFPALGYPPARIEIITSPLVTSAIDHIVEGTTFHLPAFLGNEIPE